MSGHPSWLVYLAVLLHWLYTVEGQGGGGGTGGSATTAAPTAAPPKLYLYNNDSQYKLYNLTPPSKR